MSDLQKLIEASKKYIEVKIELLKLDVEEEISRYMMRMGYLIFIFFLLSLVFLFSAISLSFYLNNVFDSSYLGFLIVAVIFLILVVVLMLLRKSKVVLGLFRRVFNIFIFD